MKKVGFVVLILVWVLALALIMMHLHSAGLPTGMVVTSVNSCFDSDGGRVIDTHGFVSGDYYVQTQTKYTEEDYCENEYTLVEFYCTGDRIDMRKQRLSYICKNGCLNGRCIDETQNSLAISDDTDIEKPYKFSLFMRMKQWFAE